MNAVIEFIVEYDKGVHTKGRKKGQMEEALTNIAAVTLNNITAFEQGTSDIFKVEFAS
jgi:hypothetical protein